MGRGGDGNPEREGSVERKGPGDQAGRPQPAVIGRAPQLQAIARALTSAREGRGELLLLCGEPGIGKSTLAQWAAGRAQAEALPVHWGFAWEAGGAPSYWPWTQVLRSLLSDPSARSRIDERGELRTALARLLPELAPDASWTEPPSLRAEEARFRLMEAVRGLLQMLASHAPFVMILEDLHAADTDSLQLLDYVGRHSAGLPVLLIGTFRDVEARASSAGAPLWQAARHGRLLRLPRMTDVEARALIGAQGVSTDEDRVRRLLAISEGNPLFLTELIDVVASRREPDLDASRLPDTLALVLREHLARLPGETQDLLAVASVLGRDFTPGDLAELSGRAVEDVVALVEPALLAEVAHPLAEEGLRFAHILFRDVLHQGLGRGRREGLHRRRAAAIRSLIEGGQPERWAELAMHLQNAGQAQRMEAIGAWRMAGRHARRGLALEAAVDAITRALDLFGAGPGADPAGRCELLLELAEATLVKGDLEAGRARCGEAYGIARVIEDPALMARAALTRGRAYVAASVDEELVDLLKETLERLPDEDRAMRARVSARLAAALQPASDPAVPMAMAREAIALARSTADDHVLYETLRSAVSALMDFARPEERIVLNREYTALAESFGDTPEQFRGNLRRMIDALELGDRRDMDAAIQVCERIAGQLHLPHYTWKVVACGALRATIRGEFAEAAERIEEAETLAAQAEDRSARLALPIQRFGLLREGTARAPKPLDEIQAELDRALELFPFAETFLVPRIASFLHQSGDRAAAEAILSDELVARALASADRSSVCAVGEIAVATGDRALAEKAYTLLLPHREHCSHWGLMGMMWDGPVAHVLALLASSFGRTDEARGLLERALAISERMQARPQVARIHAALAEILSREGDAAAARAHSETALSLARRLGMESLERAIERSMGRTGGGRVAEPTEAASTVRMTLEGDVWRVEFRGRSAVVRQSRGMEILHVLVTNPRREFHVLDLSGSAVVDPGGPGSDLDDAARAEYRQRLADLEGELAEAEEQGDLGRAERARVEQELLRSELGRAFGLGGRARPSGSAAERARVNVQRRLRDAVRRIGARLPEAGRFLENSLKTGTYCSYNPV